MNDKNTKNGAEILFWYYYCVSGLLPSAWIRMLVEDSSSSPSDTKIEAPSIFHSEFHHSEYLIRANNFRRLFWNGEKCFSISQLFHPLTFTVDFPSTLKQFILPNWRFQFQRGQLLRDHEKSDACIVIMRFRFKSLIIVC